MAKVQNGEEISAKIFNSLNRAHERYRRQRNFRQQRPKLNVVTFGYKLRVKTKRKLRELKPGSCLMHQDPHLKIVTFA